MIGVQDESGRPRPAKWPHITMHTPNLASVIPIADLGLAHVTCSLCPAPSSWWPGARCLWRRDGPDRNGVLCHANGQVIAERVRGDGIGHVLAISSGSGSATSPRESTATTAGARPIPTSRSAQPDRPLLPWTGGCLALRQVYRGRPRGCDQRLLCPQRGRHGRLACYYTDFPVVRIRDDFVTGCHNDVAGARALAVAGFPSRAVRRLRARLRQPCPYRTSRRPCPATQPASHYPVALPDRQPLQAGTQVIGRGSRLHFLTGTSWYQLDMDDIPA